MRLWYSGRLTRRSKQATCQRPNACALPGNVREVEARLFDAVARHLGGTVRHCTPSRRGWEPPIPSSASQLRQIMQERFASFLDVVCTREAAEAKREFLW